MSLLNDIKNTISPSLEKTINSSLINDIKNTINPVTIDQFKATIGKRGGAAAANRFSVTITPPSQALLGLDPNSIASSALSGNLSPGGLVNDPRDINILCQSCSLPALGIQTGDYDPHNRATTKRPTGLLREDVEFTFLLTNDYYVKRLFDRWMGSIIDHETELVGYRSEYATDVWIQQLDKKNVPIYGVKLLNAYPIGVASIALGNGDADTQSVSVTMTYERSVDEGSIKSTFNSTKNKLSILQKLL